MAQTKPAGTWTYADLFALPDDGRRYEIIEESCTSCRLHPGRMRR